MWFVDHLLKHSLIWSGYISEIYFSIQGEIFFGTFELLLGCRQLLAICNVLVLSTTESLHTVLSPSPRSLYERAHEYSLSRLFISLLHEHVAILNILLVFFFCFVTSGLSSWAHLIWHDFSLSYILHSCLGQLLDMTST